jgi:DNA-directed RNA polymerase sigma subunit (sigma70/sigma32)
VAADLQDAGSLNVRMGINPDSSEVGELLPDTRYDPELHAIEGTVHTDIREAMERLLTERERQFVRAHYGFDSGQKVTLDVIGQQAGLTRERVRQVIVGALDKLRDDPVIQVYGASLVDG